MTSKLAVYKHTLLILKERGISVALTDDEATRHTFDIVYDEALAFMLEEGSWNFATRTVAIDHSEDVQPEFGFNFIFDKPDDYANRIVAISANDRFFPALGAGEYQDEGPYIYADCDPLYLRYVSNGVSYGLDLSAWPASFTRAVQYELAFRMAPSVPNLSEGALGELEKRKKAALSNARTKDAFNQPADLKATGRLVRSRLGGAVRREGGRWGGN